MWDNPLYVLLVVMGLVVAAGGIVTTVRRANESSNPRQSYLPLGMVAVGLLIAYHTYADYRTLESQDVVIMFLFAIGFLSLMGIQFFVVDRNKHHLDDRDKTEEQENKQI